jgi:hypothetical protein
MHRKKISTCFHALWPLFDDAHFTYPVMRLTLAAGYVYPAVLNHLDADKDQKYSEHSPQHFLLSVITVELLNSLDFT